MKRLLIIISCLLIVLTGCELAGRTTGTLTLRIEDQSNSAKGKELMVILNSKDGVEFRKTLGKDMRELTIELSPGIWDITVRDTNENGRVLASGSAEITKGKKVEYILQTRSMKILGMVTDSGRIDDNSFNQRVYEGVRNAADKLGCEPRFIRPESTKTEDYLSAFKSLYDEGCRFIACPGFLFDETVQQAGKDYPDLNIVIIDSAPETSENIACVIFKEQEAGFLGGVAVALQLRTGSIGFIGGIEIPPVQHYNWGFQQGIKYANSNLGTNIEMKKENFIYSGTFADRALGNTLGSQMYDSGVDLIFQVAGGTGIGVIDACKERALNGEKVWVMGVDVDQYVDGDLQNGKSCIMTSAIKNMTEITEMLAISSANGKFQGGVKMYGAKENAVGIPSTNPNLDDSVEIEVQKIQNKIAAGEITVKNTSDGLFK